jgi:hypothetical protein
MPRLSFPTTRRLLGFSPDAKLTRAQRSGRVVSLSGLEATPWHRYREPIRTTLLRTGMIALALGAVLAGVQGGIRGGLARWPAATLIALWPALGGHFVELLFLNWLRPRLPGSRALQIIVRLVVWFIGGVLLALGMYLTAMLLPGSRSMRPQSWWWFGGGIAFIGIELLAHLALQLRGRPSFYNGRG